MIGYLRGTIAAKREQTVLLDVSGVGYVVHLSVAALQRFSVGDTAAYSIYHYVREDASELFGFEKEDELRFFERLLSVSGVGPKTALSIIGVASLERLIEAIGRGDAALFKTVSGVGSKTAERIVVELKNSSALFHIPSGHAERSAPGDADIIEALIGLGYSASQARDAVRSIPAELVSAEDRLKCALKILAR